MAKNRISELPKAIEAEEVILGSILADEENRYRTEIFEYLNQPADDLFIDLRHRALFVAFREVFRASGPIDVPALKLKLMENDALDLMKTLDFDHIENSGISRSQWRYFAKQLLRAAQRRRLIIAGQNLISIGESDELPIDEAQESAEKTVFSCRIENDVNRPQLVSDLIMETVARWEKAKKTKLSDRIKTGTEWFDSTSGGWRRGELIFVGARPSIGKSALMCNTVVAYSLKGHSVVVFALEMSKADLMDRFMAMKGEINADNIPNPEYTLDQVLHAARMGAESLMNTNILLDDYGAPTISYIRARLREQQRLGPIDLVAIDYIQLMRSEGKQESRNVEVGNISRELKLLAKEFNCPVLALSQLNRGGATEEPFAHHLRDSGSLEQDADQIAFLWKEDLAADLVKFKIEKNRNGRTGKCVIAFNKSMQIMTGANLVVDEVGQAHVIERVVADYEDDDGGLF